MFFVFVVIVWFHSLEVKALHCYGGLNLTENGIQGNVLLSCGNVTNACVKQDDPQTRMTLRNCWLLGNCTDEHGQFSPEPICTIMSEPPYIKTCCCYGDGCNGNQDDTKYKVVQEEEMQGRLRCYQGQNLLDQPVNSTGDAQLLPCFRNANGCVKLVDFNSRVIQLGCSTDNCTDELGHYASEQVCRNMTDAPHFEKCCCNGDGCNGNQDESLYKVVQEELMPANGLRCYHGQTWMDQPVNSIGGAQLLPCSQNANTCVKQVDFNHRLVQRGCTVAVRNCTDEQGQFSYTQVCKNMTDAPYQQCCCHGDGCNI